MLLGNRPYLEPLSGDRINELNTIAVLTRFAEVFYNGERVNLRKGYVGRADGKILAPLQGEYDLVYIRNNREVFLKAGGPKIYFGVPYDRRCFDEADAIAVPTQAWANLLSNHWSGNHYKPFESLYPAGSASRHRVLVFPQVVRNYEETRELASKALETDSRDLDSKPTLRHFGPIRRSNFPHHFETLLRDNSKRRLVERPEIFGALQKVRRPRRFALRKPVGQVELQQLMKSTRATWYEQDDQGHFAGSLKVLESMAWGVPVLAPRLMARVDELGKEYPLFWDREINSTDSYLKGTSFENALSRLVSMEPHEYHALSLSLIERASAFSPDSVAQSLRETLAPLLGGSTF